eukprot:CAMPEP_0182858754 /NCGR_PEP_ID=MMETSP0034_2-20130328/3864_1 /TAXON_ID=156128 /ORGANISM="Nephroselmis pyriformis, Strain CCMP717" /LENGTH=80 /DNA_ID=CAMNT_0024990227 /DNA_START=293 /DNA_END=535 /DNA_ORIENTATION=+
MAELAQNLACERFRARVAVVPFYAGRMDENDVILTQPPRQIVLSKLAIGDLGTQYFADRGIFCAGRVGRVPAPKPRELHP